MSFPQYAVSKWIGHSITVSGRHYVNDVPDELFAKAAHITPASASTPAQREAQQKSHEGAGNARKQKRTADQLCSPCSGDFRDLQESSASHCQSRKWSRGESNPRPGTVNRSRLHA